MRSNRKPIVLIGLFVLSFGAAVAEEPPGIVERLLNPDWEADVPQAVQFDRFGETLAIDGSTMVVGLPGKGISSGGHIGAARVFSRVDGRWVPGVELLPFGMPLAEEFGKSVDLQGDTLVVGSWGAAYVFRRDGQIWMPEVRLQLPMLEVSGLELYGHAVAVHGDVVAVSAPGYWSCPLMPCDNGGVVLTYRRTDGQWLLEHLLRPGVQNAGGASEYFGAALALDESWLMVGHTSHANLVGAVWAYPRETTGWGVRRLLSPGSVTGSLEFGAAIAMDEGLVVVGAPTNEESNPPVASESAGKAFVFRWSGTDWVADGRIDAPTPQDDSVFGIAVAVDDGRIAVGGEYAVAHPMVGLYEKTAGVWSELARLTPVMSPNPSWYGASVAIAHGAVIVGNPYDEDQGGLTDAAGAIYIHRPGVFASDFESVN